MRQWTVDAFAAAAFKGNPACVVEPFDVWPEDAWLQALAAENNQAETAYLRRTDDPERFDLRWFTPTMEAPLCGHATLASAHALLTEMGVETDFLAFDTLSGRLSVAREGETLCLNFPSHPPQAIAPPAGLAEALGVEPVEVWSGPFLVVVLESEAEVRSLAPDLAALAEIGEGGARGNVAVAALADPGRDYAVVSRFFAPGSGIPEDPTTGSLHCILMPLYADKLGRDRLAFHQAYPGRGGDLDCELADGRVLIRGRAVTVMDSRLRV
ncbi:MAG: PhzF family phenazine biosynthesis protein [Caulobacteraceae bacterium]